MDGKSWAVPFIQLIESISFGYPLKAWGAYVKADATHDALKIYVGLKTAPHRETGVATTGGVHRTERIEAVFFLHSLETEKFLLQRVVQLCKGMLIHEFEESFLVNGVRVMDPHATEAALAGRSK